VDSDEAAVETTQARIAQNESTFRAANERIELAAERAPVLLGKIPFICECPHLSCLETVALTAVEYEDVRAHARRFFCVPGHQLAALSVGAATVVEERDGVVVADKIGVAGEVAEQRYKEGGTNVGHDDERARNDPLYREGGLIEEEPTAVQRPYQQQARQGMQGFGQQQFGQPGVGQPSQYGGHASYGRPHGYGHGQVFGGYGPWMRPRRQYPIETKPFFLTSEFVGAVLVIAGIAITAAASEAFGAWRAWILITAVLVGYMVSRGIAKSGTRSHSSDPREQLDLSLGRGDSSD
jgi:hypothetical protein